jgi:hypothetical protein
VRATKGGARGDVEHGREQQQQQNGDPGHVDGDGDGDRSGGSEDGGSSSCGCGSDERLHTQISIREKRCVRGE